MANTLKFGNGKWYGKEGTILAYNDENYNYKPLPFNFERDSRATVVNKDGLIETVGSGQPRIDYKDDSKGALLLEPSRTNIIPSSEDINTGWQKLRVSVENNSTTSPEGSVNAGKSTVTAVSGTHASYDTLSSSVTAGNDYFISCFVKKSTTKYIRLSEGYSGVYVAFNFDDQTTDLQNDASNLLLEEHENGWYRLGFKFTADSSGNSQFALYINDNNNNSSYVGSGEAVYLWGAQIEEGSYATSYIPTQGSAVTRLSELNTFEREDLISKNLIGNTEMVWFLDAYIFNRSGTSVSPKIESTANGNIFIGLNVGSTTLNIRHKDGTSAGSTNSVPFTNGQIVKIAVKIIGTSATAFINGTNVGSFTSAAISNFNEFSSANGNPYNINDLRFYNTALTDQELQALTS